MTGLLRFVLLLFCCLAASPGMAQKTSVAQPLAAPGESTEPPRPKAAPVGKVELHALPRAGGVLVFGGAEGAGRALVEELVTRHIQVTVVVDAVDKHKDLSALGVTVAQADISDTETLKPVFASAPFRAVVSATNGAHVAENTKAITAAMATAGVPRLVLVSSIGTDDSAAALPWYAKVAAYFGGWNLDGKSKAEGYVKAANLDYTIIRAGGLSEGAASDAATITDNPAIYSQIARVDLAKILAGTIDDDTLIGKTVSAIDPTRTGLMAMFKS